MKHQQKHLCFLQNDKNGTILPAIKFVRKSSHISIDPGECNVLDLFFENETKNTGKTIR